jgi:hypothetical protein
MLTIFFYRHIIIFELDLLNREKHKQTCSQTKLPIRLVIENWPG